MLGLILGLGTTLLASAISWRSFLSLSEPNECRLLELCIAGGGDNQMEAFRHSRPGMLLTELSAIEKCPELAIATLNDALSDVDSQTRGGLQAPKVFARASLAAGVAGACAELAFNIPSSTLRATYWGLAALSCGLIGMLTCTVIGRRATLGFARRRRLWDEFVQRLLNSQFSRTEMNVLGDKLESPDGVRTVRNS